MTTHSIALFAGSLLSLVMLQSPASAEGQKSYQTKQVGPYRQCKWQYLNGIEPFKNSASDKAFAERFNPFITVSRRGLTARVVGVLSESTLERFGGSLSAVVAAYPYLYPVEYTAVHDVRAEDITKPGGWRAKNQQGEIVRTELIRMPENTVMIVYPVSIAADGYNTAAGSWRLIAKARAAPNNSAGDFGQFPFLKYTRVGHAFHGPIEGDSANNLWTLRRGKVSHGCQRMDGEHVTELSVLLGCPRAGDSATCAFANERVTVMEEFDYFPDPQRSDHSPGLIEDFAVIQESWLSPDVADYPRDDTYPLKPDWITEEGGRRLTATHNKRWIHSSQPRTDRNASVGIVRVHAYRTWDNRVTSQSIRQTPVVIGEDCI